MDYFENNFDILLQFCVFLCHVKVDFRPSDGKLKRKIFWKVTKPLVKFKAQLNHQYLSLSFNCSLKNVSRTTQIILHEIKKSVQQKNIILSSVFSIDI